MSAISANRRSAERSYSPQASRPTTALWATFRLPGLILAGYLASMILRRDNQSWTWLDGWVRGTRLR